MMRQLILAVAALVAVLNAANMRRIIQIPSGPYAGSVPLVCCDSDHDSMPEFIFHTDGPSRNEVWEHQGWNRFSLVCADTGTLPGTTMATPIPFAAGDVDNDGLTDIVCITTESDSSDPNIFYDDLITIESPDGFSYPSRLSWHYRCGNNFAIPFATYCPPDLDSDGHKEILSATPTPLGGCIWENVGNDQNELVWHHINELGFCETFGDFDLDGRMNIATASAGSDGTVVVLECTGDNQYDVMFRDTVRQPNGVDLFTTNDIDGDSLPEFYVAFENVPRGKIYLYMWEANQIGSDVYHRTLVDSVGFSGTD
jgi:hypothetical protein